MKEDKYIKKVSSNPFFRVMAWICLVIIFSLIVMTFITGVTGSKYFIGCLCLCIVVPLFMYVFLWIGRVLSSTNEDYIKGNDDEKGKK